MKGISLVFENNGLKKFTTCVGIGGNFRWESFFRFWKLDKKNVQKRKGKINLPKCRSREHN